MEHGECGAHEICEQKMKMQKKVIKCVNTSSEIIVIILFDGIFVPIFTCQATVSNAHIICIASPAPHTRMRVCVAFVCVGNIEHA